MEDTRDRIVLGPAPIEDVGAAMRSSSSSSKRLLDSTEPQTTSLGSAPAGQTTSVGSAPVGQRVETSLGSAPAGSTRGSPTALGPIEVPTSGEETRETKVRVQTSPVFEKHLALLEAQNNEQRAQNMSLQGAIALKNQESIENMRQIIASRDAHVLKDVVDGHRLQE